MRKMAVLMALIGLIGKVSARAMVSNNTSLPPLNTSPYDQLMSSIESYNFAETLIAIRDYYTSYVGGMFFIFVFGLPYVSLWIRQGESIMPAVIGFVVGGFMVAFLPTQWQLPAVALLAMAVFGYIYLIIRGR